MIRNHSIRAVADKIVKVSSNMDLCSINIVGKQGSGKSTLAKTLGHLVHTMSDIPFMVTIFGKDELKDLENTVKNLSPTNQIIIFDDISFLSSNSNKKEIDTIQSVLTTIRHLEGGKDIKIILIKNFHYSKAIPPFLRQNDFEFISSYDSNEEKNMIEMLGKENSKKIKLLKELYIAVKESLPIVFPLGRRKKFTYIPRAPFQPYLFTDGSSVRFVVAPKREWIQPVCSICNNSNKTLETKINLEEFVNDFSTKFTKGNAKAAVKIKLFQQGVNSYSKRVIQAMKYIDQYLDKKQINLEELALAYDLNPKTTKLFPDKQPEIKVQNEA